MNRKALGLLKGVKKNLESRGIFNLLNLRTEIEWTKILYINGLFSLKWHKYCMLIV